MRISKSFCLALILVFLCLGTAYGADTLDEVRTLINTRYYQDVENQVFDKTSVHEMVYSLNDPYSTYIEPALFQDFLSSLDGKYVGVGMYISEANGKVQVVNPMPGSPAEKAGLKPGDIIIRVDGKSVQGLSSSEVSGKIRGLEGTKVTVSVVRDGKGLDFTMVRTAITLPSLEYRLIGPGIGYINLYSFTSDSPQEMEEALDELQAQKMETLVLDLRDNPGGLLDVAIDIAGNFVPKGAIVHVVQKGNREYTLRSFKTPRGIPVVVLVNEGTASAAEILAGAIQDAKTGILVGNKTYGKGCVQTIFSLSNGGGLKLTTAKYLTRARQDIHGKGLTPDYIETDPHKQLEVAVKKLETNLSLFDIQMVLGSKLIFVGYHTYELPVSPYLINDSVMVPLRDVTKHCVGDVRWDKRQTVVIFPKGKLVIDTSSNIIRTEQGKIMGKAALKDGYLMVPIRALAEFMGYKTGWHQKTQSVYLLEEAN
ncbi:MAG: S41 family peptidase [Bacillota bacterium]